jgi:hypothetical protein
MRHRDLRKENSSKSSGVDLLEPDVVSKKGSIELTMKARIHETTQSVTQPVDIIK